MPTPNRSEKPNFDPASNYVTVFTGYCVDKTTGAAFDLGIPKNDGDCAAKNGYYVNGNTGSGIADNAAFSKGLNDLHFR